MFNLKWSSMSAVFGFILSLLVSLVSGAGFFSLIRALIFGAGFFGIAALLYWMVKRFLPELVNQESENIPHLDIGSQVDISLDPDDDISSLATALHGGIGDDSPAGIALDHAEETDYTNNNIGTGSFPAEGPASPLLAKPEGAYQVEAVLPSEGTDNVDVLPNVESMSQVFIPSFGDNVTPGGDGGMPVSVAFPGVERNSITPEEGEVFKGREKDSALAIQTILKRD
jgi:hypothetical protein